MIENRDGGARPVNQIAGKQDLIDRLTAAARGLQASRRANGELAALSLSDLRRAVAQRHAAHGVGA